MPVAPFSFIKSSTPALPTTYVWSAWNMDAASAANEPNAIAGSGSTYNLVNVGTVGTTTGKLSGARGTFSTSNYLKWAASGSNTTPYDIGGFSWYADGWFKTSDSAADQTVIGKIASTSGDNTGWQVLVSGGKLVVRVGLAGTTGTYTSATTVSSGSWVYFLVGNIQGNGSDSVRMYVNGTKESGVTGSYSMQGPGTTGDLGVGVNNFSGTLANAFNGYLDTIAFYSGRQTTLLSTWALVETKIITPRYNGGAGQQF